MALSLVRSGRREAEPPLPLSVLNRTRAASGVEDPDASKAKARRRAQFRAGLMRQALRWHWISAAICLVGLFAFTVTGITLNHASDIPADTRVAERQAVLPAAERAALIAAADGQGALPAQVRAWLRAALDVTAPADAAVEWTDAEAYVALKRPGMDAWVSLDGATGEVLYERTDRGWVAYFNDLHKGRDTGLAWKWFIDIFAAGCLVFCVTGLILLQLHARMRPSTWPLVGLGLIVPLLLALFFIH